MADKLLMGSLVISLCYTDLLPMWLMGIVVFRDVFLLGAGFVIRYISLPPPVSEGFTYIFVAFVYNHLPFLGRKPFRATSTPPMLLPNWSPRCSARSTRASNWPPLDWAWELPFGTIWVRYSKHFYHYWWINQFCIIPFQITQLCRDFGIWLAWLRLPLPSATSWIGIIPLRLSKKRRRAGHFR